MIVVPTTPSSKSVAKYVALYRPFNPPRLKAASDLPFNPRLNLVVTAKPRQGR